MDFGLKDLPQVKWGSGTGRQVILKGDFAKIEAAILQAFGIISPPAITWVDATEIKVLATADCPAQVMMNGLPNILHPGLFVGGGLTDGRYRENTADATLDLDLGASLWGTEKASQWYAVYAKAGNADEVFTLKAMPWMRVKSQASQVISLGTGLAPATGIGYGFVTDELSGGMIYGITGASRGLMRAITANNNDNGTGGTITYTGTALTLAEGNWFIVLPPGVNFRWIGDFYNEASSNINTVNNLFFAESGYLYYDVAGVYYWTCPANVYKIYLRIASPGGGCCPSVSGGGGGYREGWIDVISGVTYVINLGIVGIGHQYASGEPGGTSWFGVTFGTALMSVPGGGGGTYPSGPGGAAGNICSNPGSVGIDPQPGGTSPFTFPFDPTGHLSKGGNSDLTGYGPAYQGFISLTW